MQVVCSTSLDNTKVFRKSLLALLDVKVFCETENNALFHREEIDDRDPLGLQDSS